jgi:hypothetical protein
MRAGKRTASADEQNALKRRREVLPRLQCKEDVDRLLARVNGELLPWACDISRH